ncbi:winged helix-turn-helix domain-containing protein [Deinococcus aquaedulcis]|uniref:winged helix-turn-helix domain-containing protein n=1 Tax=Deinococcus aquaedulcis TaxID=2840455 RepID=UPI001C834234|nr:winged helix-turn-helix domain-containing protein [Deinococcus aquaedulcis]
MSDTPPLTVQTPEQALALLDPQTLSLLGAFAEPMTPSEAARSLGQPANRVTYHVRRLLSLGLLETAQTVGKRARYQVVAVTFVVPYRLTAAADVSEMFTPLFREVSGRFAQAARDRAQELSEERLEGAITLRLGHHQPLHMDPPPAALIRYALNANVRTFDLNAEDYAALQAELGELLERYAARATAAGERRPCTAVAITFPGALFEAAPEAGA